MHTVCMYIELFFVYVEFFLFDTFILQVCILISLNIVLCKAIKTHHTNKRIKIDQEKQSKI